jgi:hypothetical protein
LGHRALLLHITTRLRRLPGNFRPPTKILWSYGACQPISNSPQRRVLLAHQGNRGSFANPGAYLAGLLIVFFI